MASMLDITKAQPDGSPEPGENPEDAAESATAQDEKHDTDNVDELYGRPSIPDFAVMRSSFAQAAPYPQQQEEVQAFDESLGESEVVVQENESIVSLAEFLGQNTEYDEASRDPFAEGVFSPDIAESPQAEDASSEEPDSSVDYFFGGDGYGVLDLPGGAGGEQQNENYAESAPIGEEALTNPFQFDSNRYANTGLTPVGDAPYDTAAQQNEHIGTLADAVQNALRNVYGPETDGSQEATFQDPLRLILPTPAARTTWDNYDSAASSDIWNEAGGGSFESKPVSAAELDETTTEAVLSYLYNQSEAATARPRPASVHALDDLLDAVERNRRDNPYIDEQDATSRADLEVPPIAAAGYSGSNQESPYYRGGSLRSPLTRKPAEEISAKSPQLFAGEAGPAPGKSGLRVEAAGRNPIVSSPLASPQDRESSRMLGAAGLGLIGGIALAGILSVFVFNSVVTNSGTGGLDGASGDAVSRSSSDGSSNALEKSVARLETPPRDATAAAAVTSPASREGVIAASDASGSAPGPFALNISVDGSYRSENVLVSVKGVPDQARLSSGIDVGGGAWLLPPQRLDGLQISMPSNQSGVYELEVQVMQSDARTPVSDAKRFALTVTADARDKISDEAVQTALAALQLSAANRAAPAQELAKSALVGTDSTASVAAPPKAAPGDTVAEAASNLRIAALPKQTKVSSDPQKSQQFIRDGNRLMRDGDVVSARKLYDEAAALGDPDALLAMGRSYDPSYFEQLQVKTGKPDPAQAFDWYMKALDNGVDTAKVKIDTLKQWLLR